MKKSEPAILVIQLISVLLLLFVLFNILNFQLINGSLSFTFNLDINLIFSFIILLFLIFLLYFASKKRFPYAYFLQKETSNLILETVSKKAMQAKEEPRIIILVFIEIIFAFFIAYSLYVAFDPEAEYFAGLVDWSYLNLGQTEVLFVKIIFFIVITGFFLWLYNNTKPFRKAMLSESPKDKLIRKLKERW